MKIYLHIAVYYVILIFIAGFQEDVDHFIKFQDKDQSWNWSSNEGFLILAAVGSQSSGKSTLLNCLFNTTFPVGAGVGKATTKGVIAQIQQYAKAQAHSKHLILLDVEGTESQERGRISAAGLFDARMLESSARVADVLIVNLWAHDVARQELRHVLLPVLKGCFTNDSKVSIPAAHKQVFFVFRDLPDQIKTEDLANFVRNEIDSTMQVHFKELVSRINGTSQIFRFRALINYQVFPELFQSQCTSLFDDIITPLLDLAPPKYQKFPSKKRSAHFLDKRVLT